MERGEVGPYRRQRPLERCVSTSWHDAAMQAVRYHAYGAIDRLRLETAPDPRPRGDELLVRVVCAALNPKDALFRKGRFRFLSGMRFPKTPGLDFAGRVVEDPRAVLGVGRRVFGALAESSFVRGALAEQIAVAPREVAALPDGVSFEQAAATPLAGLTALQALRDLAGLVRGQRLLVNGASGGVGTFAIQIGRLLGAHVTSISSAANRPLCGELGANDHLAYDLPEEPRAPFDVIFDVFGNLPFERARSRLAGDGIWVGTVPSAALVVKEAVARVLGRGRERLVIVESNRRDLDLLAGWLDGGEIRAVIDHVSPLADYATSFRRLESKRTRGKIVLTLGGPASRGA